MTIGHEAIGSGAHKVITLHGWFGDHTTFHPLRGALSLDEFTYAAVAYRGYGLSRQIKGRYTMPEIAGDVLELADKLGWSQFSLIGHSMGGMAVQRILADAPGRVRKIVAITPVPASGVPFDPDGWKLFEGAAASLDNRRGIIDFTTGGRRPAVQGLDRRHGALFRRDREPGRLRRLSSGLGEDRLPCRDRR